MNITTRNHTARRNAQRVAFETVAERLAARVSPDAPAKIVRKRVHHVDEDAALRVPDFREDGMAVFIGEDATVMVEESVLERLDTLLHVSGIHARGGHMPDEQGIAVFPHADAYEARCYTGRNAEAQTAWRLAHDTLIAS